MDQAKQISPIFGFGIRQKLLLILLIVLLSALTVSGWMALEHEKVNTLQEINQRGSDISRFVAKSLSFSVIGYDYHTIQLLLDEITSSGEIGYARVMNQKGNVMGEAGVRESGYFSSLVLFSQDIKLDDDVVGKLELGLSTANTIKRLEQKKYAILKREAIIVLLIALGEFIALSIFIIRPVRIMAKTLADGVDENGHITDMIPVVSRDEFGQLAESFNYLGTRLNEANEKLQAKIDLADRKLLETNQQLRAQSEELRIMSDNFKKLARTDALTSLCNRRHFEDLMHTELNTARRHDECNSMIIFDIDHFKKINDDYGHPGGDSILKDLSALLKERIRKTDFLCRLGGEEFVVLCKRADKYSAMLVAEELRETVEKKRFSFAGQSIKITISLGIATTGQSGDYEDPDVVYQHADQAVYHSKQKGRNRCTHFDDIGMTVPEGQVND